MPRFPQSNDSPPEAPLDNRPPVLNQQYCTCHRASLCSGDCEGIGKDGRSDGGEGDRSDGNGATNSPSETYVASNRSAQGVEDNDDIVLPATTEHFAEFVHLENFVLQPATTREIQDFLARFSRREGNVGFPSRLGPYRLAETDEEIPRYLFALNCDGTASPDSMHNEHGGSGQRSVASSRYGSIHSSSPGPGLCSWADAALRALPHAAHHMSNAHDVESQSDTAGDSSLHTSSCGTGKSKDGATCERLMQVDGMASSEIKCRGEM